MANEGDKKAVPSSSHPPPPCDPFPTYQTPYPRTQNNEENPFIQFRRFADQQFHSFFTGLPQIFGFTTPDSFQKELQDMMKRRHDAHEGWRKQVEQDMEEMKQAYQKKRDELETSAETMQPIYQSKRDEISPSGDNREPWWTRGAAAKCPALNQEQSERALKCPEMYDRSGNPQTELDVYEHVEQMRKPDSRLDSEGTAFIKSNAWGPSLGYDGKRRLLRLQEQLQEPENNIPQLHQWMMARPKRYTRFQARNMDPVSDPQDIIPWLMLSPYSPAYLCNPHQPRMFKVHIQQNEEVPMQIVRPRFCGERNPSELDQQMSKIPWADAFEDLVSLEQTGKMVERNYNTYRTPRTWIHDMVHRGSLGPKWGFNDEGKLVRKPQAAALPLEATKVTDVTNENDVPAQNLQQPTWDEDREAKEKFVKSIVNRMEEVEKQVPILGPLMHKIWHSPEDIFSAVATYEKEGREAIEKAIVSEQKDVPAKQEQDMTAPQEKTFSYSSNSSSSWNYDSSNDKTDSVVSTMTRTESRTLPDGSVETRRVLKRRFADGREVGEESVDVQPATITTTRQPNTQTTYKQLETDTEKLPNAFSSVQDEVKKQQKKGGWFWN